MEKIILYHGSPEKKFTPEYGKGNDKHDYGRGFYLTDNKELAQEWAVCIPDTISGWVHKYELNCTGLKILDFEEKGILVWLAELMKHRDTDESRRYRVLSKKFIEKYAIDTEGYDVIKGWRANASYFYIAKAFVRDEIDMDILEELLHLGDLGIQYSLKSEKAFQHLKEIVEECEQVDYHIFNEKYNARDIYARNRMKELINSEENKVEKVFSTLI